MSTLWDTFREGGFMNWILLLFGLVGAMAAFVAFILAAMRSRAALPVGAGVILFGALIAGLGLVGMSMGRRSVENVLAGEAISAGMKERIRRAGYAESLSCVKFGLGFSALPILAGALAMLSGALRRSEDSEPGAPRADAAPPGAAPPSPRESSRKPSFALPAVALGVAGLILVADFVALATPLPGRAIDESDKDSASLEEPSAAADPANDPPNPLGEAPEAPEEADDSAALAPPPQGSASASANTAAGSAAAAAEGSATAAAKPAAPPKVNAGSPTVSGRLPPEVIRRIVRVNFGRFRLCYENGLKNNPDLKGRVNVRFVIARDGSVSAVSNAGSDLPDPGVVSCVVRAFRGLSFPQPEGGIVTVVYPITFASS
jgi:hypothetical protein